MGGFPRLGLREKGSEPGGIYYNVSKARKFKPRLFVRFNKQTSVGEMTKETTHTSKIV